MSEPLLRGKYRLGERLGVGGMAEVLAAVNLRTEREVAIKRLLPAAASRDDLVTRFEREARAAGRIKNPHVVEIIDIDRDERGQPFLVMERLRGRSLADVLQRCPRLEPAQALALAVQLLRGVEAAHAASVIHRDLKPGNVFLERGADGVTVKLLDFGISKITTDEPSELTRDGETIGTFAYMPPEQIQGSDKVGPAADIWACGATLFRMLTGGNAFVGDAHSLLSAVLTQAPARLSAGAKLDEPLASSLQSILDRALAKQPEERFASAAKMRAALEEAARASGTSTSPSLLAGLVDDSEVTHATFEANATRAPGRRGMRVGLAALTLAVVGGLGVWLVRKDPAAPDPSAGVGPERVATTPAPVSAPPDEAIAAPAPDASAARSVPAAPSLPKPKAPPRPQATPKPTAVADPPAPKATTLPALEASRPPAILKAPY